MPGETLEARDKKESATLACRFDKTLYKMLQNDAKEKGISLNALVNSIAKRYISWEKYASEVGFIPLAKETIRLVFDELDDKKIKQIAVRIGRTVPRELILLMFNKIDFSTISSFLEITLSRYGTIRHEINGDAHDFILHHNVNKKFSQFLAGVATAMAEDLAFNITVQNVDRDILFITFREISNT